MNAFIFLKRVTFWVPPVLFSCHWRSCVAIRSAEIGVIGGVIFSAQFFELGSDLVEREARAVDGFDFLAIALVQGGEERFPTIMDSFIKRITSGKSRRRVNGMIFLLLLAIILHTGNLMSRFVRKCLQGILTLLSR